MIINKYETHNEYKLTQIEDKKIREMFLDRFHNESESNAERWFNVLIDFMKSRGQEFQEIEGDKIILNKTQKKA